MVFVVFVFKMLYPELLHEEALRHELALALVRWLIKGSHTFNRFNQGGCLDLSLMDSYSASRQHGPLRFHTSWEVDCDSP